MIQTMTRETVRCEGIRERIKREVFNAAVTPKGATDRKDRLDFWHRLQRNADRVFYLNGAGRKAPGKLTKIERADIREMERVPAWRPCPNEIVAFFPVPNSPEPFLPEWYVRRMKRADRIAECIVAVLVMIAIVAFIA